MIACRERTTCSPGPDFEPVEADLEDVYFCAIAGRIGRRRESSEKQL